MPATLLPAFYLASSWLWCIGAFLPVLLLRDYGWGALLVFTLANVTGAAAFGWVLKKKQQANFLLAHSTFLKLFSRVTVAFQLFFVAWLSVLVSEALLVVFLLLAWVFYRAERWIGWVAVGLFVVSMLLFAHYGWVAEPRLPLVSLQTGWWHSLLPLMLGFALSPYLDLTFHRALALSPNPRLSFSLGFGVFFLSLLVFVFFYSDDLSQLMAGEGLNASLIWPVIAFILVQTAFTVGVHLQELQRLSPLPWLQQLLSMAGYWVLLVLLLKTWAFWPLPWTEITLTEALYKAFLYFYGLVFPLYLLLNKKPFLYAWALLLATPGFALGFMLGGAYLPWLSLSMLVVVAFLVVYFKPRLFAVN